MMPSGGFYGQADAFFRLSGERFYAWHADRIHRTRLQCLFLGIVQATDMGESSRQAFLKRFFENNSDKENFSLLETVSEHYEKNFANVPYAFARYGLAKDRIVFYKHKLMADLPDYLMDFETGLTATGAKVIYAETAADAAFEICRLVSKGDRVFVSKDRLVNEIGLAARFKSENISFENSRLVDFPYRMLPYPSSVFLQEMAKKIGLEDTKVDLAQQSSMYKRHIADALFKDSVYISGADFLVSTPASVVKIENTGNENLFASFCTKQIIVAGIDQMIPSLQELDYFTSLFTIHAHGSLQAWNHVLYFGPKRQDEIDGPQQMHVILVDNGRTRLLKEDYRRSVFNCIHCDACTALCPVFKHFNLPCHENGSRMMGPLDCVTMPVEDGFDKSGFMAFACTLCGKCSEVCPAGINFQEMILYNRKESVERESFMAISRSQMKLLRKMMLKQKVLDSSYHRLVLKMNFKKSFGSQKEFPDLSKKSFHLRWQENRVENR